MTRLKSLDTKCTVNIAIQTISFARIPPAKLHSATWRQDAKIDSEKQELRACGTKGAAQEGRGVDKEGVSGVSMIGTSLFDESQSKWKVPNINSML